MIIDKNPLTGLIYKQRIRSKYTTDIITGCWTWLAGCDGHGYPRVFDSGKMKLAHRIIYELYVDKIPEGMELHHKCENIKCVNPDHMEPLTRQDHNKIGNNISTIHRQKTHCTYGHEFNEKNTGYYISKGVRCRYCKECSRRRTRVARTAK